MKMHIRERKSTAWRITKTPKKGVTSRDRSFGREQQKSCEETGEERFKTLIKYNNDKQNMLVLYKRWKKIINSVNKKQNGLEQSKIKNHPPSPNTRKSDESEIPQLTLTYKYFFEKTNSPGGDGMPLLDAVGVNCQNGATTDINLQEINMQAKGCLLDNCVGMIRLDMSTPPRSWHITIITIPHIQGLVIKNILLINDKVQHA